MSRILAIMAPASLSLLPLALASSSARMAARLVTADFSLLLHMGPFPQDGKWP